jgi:hypothetical protein
VKRRDAKLVRRKQGEASLPYSDSEPSEVDEVYWIYAERKKGEYPKSTARSGKWLIFVEREKVDDVWFKIKRPWRREDWEAAQKYQLQNRTR